MFVSYDKIGTLKVFLLTKKTLRRFDCISINAMKKTANKKICKLCKKSWQPHEPLTGEISVSNST